jgi:hypothetical protein
VFRKGILRRRIENPSLIGIAATIVWLMPNNTTTAADVLFSAGLPILATFKNCSSCGFIEPACITRTPNKRQKLLSE